MKKSIPDIRNGELIITDAIILFDPEVRYIKAMNISEHIINITPPIFGLIQAIKTLIANNPAPIATSVPSIPIFP